MYFDTNEETCNEIKKAVEGNDADFDGVRLYVAGMACSGVRFGVALDKQNEDDYAEELFGLNFIIEKDVFAEYGEVEIKWQGDGYLVRPVNQEEADCGGCTSC